MLDINQIKNTHVALWNKNAFDVFNGNYIKDIHDKCLQFCKIEKI